MERQHQKVKCGSEYILLSDAISRRAELIKIKNEYIEKVRSYEATIVSFSEHIEYACDHDWNHETEYSCGERDRWSHCKICGLTKGGHIRNSRC